MYVIVRIPDGQYVQPPGREKSYSPFLQDAQVFVSKEDADINCCTGNEQVIPLESAFRTPPRR